MAEAFETDSHSLAIWNSCFGIKLKRASLDPKGELQLEPTPFFRFSFVKLSALDVISVYLLLQCRSISNTCHVSTDHTIEQAFMFFVKTVLSPPIMSICLNYLLSLLCLLFSTMVHV